MIVEFGLFEGDKLLQRGKIKVTEQEKLERLGDVTIFHCLLEDAAKVILEVYQDEERLIKSTMNIPVHESEDWESIELAQFTLAFKCILDS